jgi:2-desacetyl-2-hydroxyethyl bacteriochlorophyllide A dehydrogenase
MKAAVFEAREDLAIRDVAEPEPGPDDLVLEVERTGMCGTDIHIFKGEYTARYPLVPGHELAGTVVAVGANVRSFAIGSRVAIDPNVYCGACHYCRRQRNNHCLAFNAIGVTRDGGFAERVLVPAANAYDIGDMPALEAAFIEPVSCAVYGIQRVRIDLGDQVAVFGAGPIGLILAQLARHAGASRVAVVDLSKARLELAERLGAHPILAGDGSDAELRRLAPHGFDVSIDATGVPRVVERLFDHTTAGGRVLLFGVCPRDSRITVDPFVIYHRDLEVYGSFSLCYTFDAALRILQARSIDVAPLVSHTLPLDEFGHALELFESSPERMKIQIAPA